MSDPNPPQPFNWNLPPAKPEDAAEATPPEQPAPPPWASAPPPVVAPTPAAPAVQQPRPDYTDVPTEAIASYDPFATQALPFDGALSGATEVLGAQPVGLPELRDESLRPPTQASAIDSLFGASQFKEYDASAFPSEGISALAPTRERQPREPLGKPQKVLLWVAGGLVAALALVGLFVAGTKIGTLFPAEPEPEVAAPAASAVPAQPVPLGPVEPGEHAWNELLGTECLDPYVSAWQDSYAVVDCATPHAAQMVFHGFFGDEAWAPYPGLGDLQSRINLLCTAPTTVNYPVAAQFSDIQIAASYAATADEWDAGQRDYYCFVTRSSLEPLTVSVANAPVVVEGLTATVPGNDP